jgi:two-component system cell cycle sensor histidine kinase/response regulator CckA
MDKAAEITRQWLAFSRKQFLDVEPVDLYEVLTESEFLRPRLIASDVELTFQHGASQSWLRAETSPLEQVIANLAINARDAMPGKGRLSITTRNASQLRADAHLTEGVALPSNWLVLEVQDTRCGIRYVRVRTWISGWPASGGCRVFAKKHLSLLKNQTNVKS